MLKIKLVRSKIGASPKQRRTLEALGLRKIHQERSMESSKTVLGMVDKVKHLVEVTSDETA
ncbi:50S ribosomal protein L30 [Desulfohalobium retbaense]|uniref:50S ribosomal protein L30 n=1 Tax=Desulfohalobium retbaense (strain ATCC 49708 / DSM 5692 / JCM 16813 / HR100) TaxID=485915 RepID=C8X457_DESRD|nr:50S ribosomal protein L30 [Desulfohalobium retbaense]ACV69331.1 ribosomal protein L30 [Desulfohalobium retbaense DSM 5692]